MSIVSSHKSKKKLKALVEVKYLLLPYLIKPLLCPLEVTTNVINMLLSFIILAPVESRHNLPHPHQHPFLKTSPLLSGSIS
jgi:hypothetical protein